MISKVKTDTDFNSCSKNFPDICKEQHKFYKGDKFYKKKTSYDSLLLNLLNRPFNIIPPPPAI